MSLVISSPCIHTYIHRTYEYQVPGISTDCCYCCCCSVCCCFVASAAAAVRHSTPATRIHANSSAYIHKKITILEYTPWQYSSRVLCGLGVHLYYTSRDHYGHARSRKRTSAHRGESPLVFSMEISETTHVNSNVPTAVVVDNFVKIIIFSL